LTSSGARPVSHFVLEAGVEALARALDLVLVEPLLDDQEALALVLLDLPCRGIGHRHA